MKQSGVQHYTRECNNFFYRQLKTTPRAASDDATKLFSAFRIYSRSFGIGTFGSISLFVVISLFIIKTDFNTGNPTIYQDNIHLADTGQIQLEIQKNLQKYRCLACDSQLILLSNPKIISTEIRELRMSEQNAICCSNLLDLREQRRNIRKDKKIKLDATKTEYPLIKLTALGQLGWKPWSREDPKDDANVIWVDHYVTEQFVKRLKPYQKVNHFSASQELGRKSSLGFNLNHMRRLIPAEYSFFPTTWTLPEETDDYNKFRQENPEKYYIVKPAASSQGKGIYLTKKVQLQPDRTDKHEEMVVQQYICDPLLLDNLKFDFRIYVLIKSLLPLKIFVFREGLARLATRQYQEPSQENLSFSNMHLTNYAINKVNPAFVQNRSQLEDNIGHKRTLTAAMKQLEGMGCDTSKLQSQIDDIIVKTIMAGYCKMVDAYKGARDTKEEGESVCFEILGFDVMLTRDFLPKLIEVNHTPSFCTDTPLDYIVKKCLVIDTLNLLNIDSRNKIDFIKRRSHENGNQLWCKNTDFRNQRIAEEMYEADHLGGFRKLFPIPGRNRLLSEDPLTSTETIFKKINEKYNPKTKKSFRQTVVDTSKYSIRRSRDRQRLEEEIMKYETLEIESTIPLYSAEDALKAIALKSLTYTYYNILRKQESPLLVAHQLDQCPGKEEKLMKRNFFLDKSERDSQSKKYNSSPIKLKNINIDFEEGTKRKEYLYNMSFDPSKTVTSKFQDRTRFNSTSPPGGFDTFGSDKLRTHSVKKAQMYRAQQRQKEVYYDNELKARINKMKVARIRLHKIKKIERGFLGNGLGVSTDHHLKI